LKNALFLLWDEATPCMLVVDGATLGPFRDQAEHNLYISIHFF